MNSTADLFGDSCPDARGAESLGREALLLRGFALDHVDSLLPEMRAIVRQAPLRQMQTPGGRSMAVAMSNCGPLGWISDRDGYRYSTADPLSGQAWPDLPGSFTRLATTAARQAGFADFVPDACLINRYAPGTRLSLHQDRDERDFSQPIVSVSLGLPAVFLFGGLTRGERAARVPLAHGDVVVWGGADRLRFHGVMPLKPGRHPQLGEVRMNLTFRKAG